MAPRWLESQLSGSAFLGPGTGAGIEFAPPRPDNRPCHEGIPHQDLWLPDGPAPRARVERRDMKKLYVKTYGCQMNTYDSARMADLLAPLGYVQADSPDDADMVILNTCHIREKAAEKVYSEVGRLRALKAERTKNGGRMLLAVAGCVAQAEGQEIVARAPAVDLVVGPQSYHRLPEMIARAARHNGHALETDFPALEKFDSL